MSKFHKKIHCVKCGDLLSSNFRVYTNSTIYCPECVTLLHLGEIREEINFPEDMADLIKANLLEI